MTSMEIVVLPVFQCRKCLDPLACKISDDKKTITVTHIDQGWPCPYIGETRQLEMDQFLVR
jgi:hypothetical protein